MSKNNLSISEKIIQEISLFICFFREYFIQKKGIEIDAHKAIPRITRSKKSFRFGILIIVNPVN